MTPAVSRDMGGSEWFVIGCETSAQKSVNYGWPTFSGLTPLRGRAIRGCNGSARRASS
jgi:hypothetical protein